MLSQFLGMIVAMIATPCLISVDAQGVYRISQMLMAYGIITAVGAVIVLVFLREKPPTPPCKEGQDERYKVFEGLRHMLKNRDMILLILSAKRIFHINLRKDDGMGKKPTYEELLKRVKKLEKNFAESKRVAKDLEQEKKFSEKVLNSLPGIFYLYDEDGINVRWNRNHEILTGFTAEEISSRKILDWFDEDEKKHIASRVKETFTRGQSDAEGYLVIKSGERVPYYFTAMRMISANRKYLLGMGTDLSKLKKTQDGRITAARSISTGREYSAAIEPSR